MGLFHCLRSLFEGKNAGKILELVFISTLVVIVIYLIGSWVFLKQGINPKAEALNTEVAYVVCLVYLVLFVYLVDHINQMNQRNQINQKHFGHLILFRV
jgi:Kef-type K+ transport system membrane component KefB